ncbi:zinc finger/thioredoxin domain containing protein [Janthinobacterium sp. HH01]|nr:zinc finger/thioredoxin domain containing protein [Janthinobacterium sp. HH01]
MRCGSCNEVFDGNAALLEPLAAPATAPVAAQLPSPLPEPVDFDEKMAALDTRAAEVLSSDEAEPIYTLELDTALDAAETAEAADTAVAADQSATEEAAAPPDSEPADAIALPTEPATLPPVVEEALDLDLDVEAEPEPEPEPEQPELPEPAAQAATGPEPEPATDAEWSDDEPLENALSIEAMSDEELEAALAAELAVLEQDSTEQPAGDTEAAPDTFTSVLPAERLEPTLDEAPPADTTAVPTAASRFNELEEIDEEALVQLSSSGLAEAQSARAHAHLLAAPADTDADSADTAAEEPGFIKRERRRQKFGKAATIAMSLGSLLLLATLAAQGLTTFRNQIAAALPPLKPALTAACNALGCKIELPAQIDDLSIEQGELQTLSDTSFSFTTQLRNQSATAQAWPHIELVLDDANDKAVLRRVFTPREYLGADVALDKGFAPHTEQSVKLYFELSQLKASGYHIAVFYP